eukprot:CCRYP_004976-RF/>CCRYP_004976-RF protein AED:0.07 eAED:0.07 QI:3538/0.88/0.8/1/0.55/0.5/10/3647/1039
MPLNMWDSPPDIERAPLSTTNGHHEDEERTFIPYSDVPRPKVSSPSRDTDKQRRNNGSREGSGGKNRSGGVGTAIMIEEEDEPIVRRKSEFSEEYSGRTPQYEDEYGEYSSSIGDLSFGKPSKRPHYRSSLIGAYLRHCFGNMMILRACRLLFFLFLLLIVVFCATSIGYIIAQDGNPFSSDRVNADGNSKNAIIPKLIPPPPYLHNICSDWVTMSGRKNCKSYCDNALCCSLPDSDKNSCWKENADDCATYRSGCMALELHSSVGRGGDGDAVGNVDSTNNVDDHVSGTGIGALSSVIDLPPPPIDLVDICSSSSLATPEGFNACSDACRPSRCCSPNLYDCQLEKESSKRYCTEYEDLCRNVAETWRGSGHGVGGANDVNSVSNQVMMKCNADNLNPPDSCIEACTPGACCYVSSSYPPIEQLFDQYYGKNQNPMKAVTSCTSNIGFCQQYGSCEHLNHLQDTSGWQSDDYTYELSIDSVCMVEYIAKNGALECSNVCQPAHCCFSTEYSCGDTQLSDLNCEKYAKCKALYPKQKSVGDLLHLAEQIDDICSNALDSLVARSECQDQCKGHLCCFDDGAYGCADDASQNCLAYAGCEILVDTPQSVLQTSDQGGTNVNNGVTKTEDLDPDTISTTPLSLLPAESVNVDISAPSFSELNEICNEKYMISNGIQTCQSLCKPYECCFAKDVDCTYVSPSTCNGVTPCSNFFTPQKEEVVIEKECSREAIHINPDPCLTVCEPYSSSCLPTKQLIFSIYSNAIIHSSSGCFTDEQCPEHISGDCDLYSPCEILLDSSTNDQSDRTPTTLDLKEFCSIANLGNNWNSCISHCEPYECCFAQSDSCSVSQQMCAENDFCKGFFGSGSDSGSIVGAFDPLESLPLPLDVTLSEKSFEEACSPSTLGENWNVCISHCEPYECCFTGTPSCNKDKSQCGNHSMCAQFFAKSVPMVSNSFPNESTPSSVTNAPEEQEDDGPIYMQYTAIELAKACNSKQLSKDDSDCKMLCKGSACCFSSYESSNCYKRQKSFCHDHAICESVFDQ